MKVEGYLELLDCIMVIVSVILHSRAKAVCEKLEKEMLLQIDETVTDAGTTAVLTNKRLQLCNAAVLLGLWKVDLPMARPLWTNSCLKC